MRLRWMVGIALLSATGALAEEPVRRSVPHRGIERHFTIRPAVPNAPLVIVLHGLTQPIDSLRASLPFDAVAGRERFAVAYPEAIAGRWSYRQGGGVTLPGRDDTEVDDIGFILAMIDTVVAEGVADPARITVTGISRGALMAWSLICVHPERFAAAAPLSSGMTDAHLASCPPGRPMPIVVVAGTADPIQAYDGWLQPGVPRLLSIPETMEFWRRRHGCTGQAGQLLPHREAADPTRTQRIAWTGCVDGGPLVLYRVAGGGHQPPSFTPNIEEQRRVFGRRGQDVETAEAIWRVFADSLPRTR